MRGAIIAIAALVALSVFGLLASPSGRVPKALIAALATLGVMALICLAFLFLFEGMGGD